jgi:hypothetical protein
MTTVRPGALTFNHVAVTVPRDSLDAAGRERIAEVFTECLGFTEFPSWTKDRELLVLTWSGENVQVASMHDAGVLYLVFLGHDSPATGNPGNMGDHFGVTCGSLEEYEGCLRRAQEFARREPGLEIGGPEVLRSEHENEHRFYFRFGMPIACEVQYQELVA